VFARATTGPAMRRAAHRVVLGAFEGSEVPAWLPTLVEDGLGGICLYGNNLTARPADVLALAGQVGTLSPALVVTLDEEGGDVTRLHYGTGSPFPGNAVLGRYDDPATTADVAAAIGAELKAAGIWLDLAPDADINSNPHNPVIGTRSFGDTPEVVARHTAAWVGGLQAQGVAACVKHFPGHGDTEADSHLALPRVDADLATLRGRELVPFVAAIEAGAATVMTSHLLLPALDPTAPATLSRTILTGLLREELGFDGVIVTDALDMAGASAAIGIPAAAVASLVAGADLLCLGPSLRGRGPGDILEVVEAILAAVGSGHLSTERLLDAAARVDALAATYGTGTVDVGPAVVERGLTAGRTAAAAVLDAVGPLRPGTPRVVRIDTGANIAVGHATWGDLGLGPLERTVGVENLPDVVALSAHDGPVVVVARAASSDDRAWTWLRSLVEHRPDTLVVELGWPAPELEALPRVVRGWGASAAVSHAVGDVIMSALAASTGEEA
jgi:beta-N-acetylhexosaminidase